MIIPIKLKIEQEEKLVETLRSYQKTIGWSIEDKRNKPIDLYTSLDKGANNVDQPKRTLNPHMQEVVNTKVIKLLDPKIICPICDSTWVSLTQVMA